MTRRIPWVAAAALFLASSTASAQTSDQATALARAVKGTVTSAALDRHAREITRWPRPSGSPGENAATDYVAATLRAAGVPVEVHEFMAYTSNPVSAMVTVPGTDFAPDAITMSFSGATDGVEAPVVDAGTLDDLPALEVGTGERLTVLDAARFAHVRGKVVVVTGQPRNIPTAALQELGAVAAIFVNPEERLNELIVTKRYRFNPYSIKSLFNHCNTLFELDFIFFKASVVHAHPCLFCSKKTSDTGDIKGGCRIWNNDEEVLGHNFRFFGKGTYELYIFSELYTHEVVVLLRLT